MHTIYSIIPTPIPPPKPPSTSHRPPNFIVSLFFFLTDWVQFAPEYERMWDHSQERCCPTKDHTSKDNWLSFPKQPSTVKSSSARGLGSPSLLHDGVSTGLLLGKHNCNEFTGVVVQPGPENTALPCPTPRLADSIFFIAPWSPVERDVVQLSTYNTLKGSWISRLGLNWSLSSRT